MPRDFWVRGYSKFLAFQILWLHQVPSWPRFALFYLWLADGSLCNCGLHKTVLRSVTPGLVNLMASALVGGGVWYESKHLEMLWSSGTAGVQLHPSLSTEKGHIFLLETVRVLGYRSQKGSGSRQMVPGKQVLWDEQQLERGRDTPQSKLFCIWVVTFLNMFSPGL